MKKINRSFNTCNLSFMAFLFVTLAVFNLSASANSVKNLISNNTNSVDGVVLELKVIKGHLKGLQGKRGKRGLQGESGEDGFPGKDGDSFFTQIGTNIFLQGRSDLSIDMGNLSVGGDIKVGNSGEGCTNANEGGTRYNKNNKVMEFCNGNIWQNIANSGKKPMGSILQVVTAVSSDKIKLSLSNYSDIISAKITPKSSTSKILIFYSATGFYQIKPGKNYHYHQILRNNIIFFLIILFRWWSTHDNTTEVPQNWGFNYPDLPTITGELIYKIQAYSTDYGIQINPYEKINSTTLILMEVAQ